MRKVRALAGCNVATQTVLIRKLLANERVEVSASMRQLLGAVRSPVG